MPGSIRHCLLAAAAAAAAAVAGCATYKQTDPLVVQVNNLQQENSRLRDQLQQATASAASQQERIQTLQGLGPKRLDRLYSVTRIDITRYSGGVNLGDGAGDQGVRLYIRPLDQQGDVIKAAGTFKVQVFDLAQSPQDSLVVGCEYPPEETAKHWYGGFITYQYQFDCLWKSPPRHADLTVQVSFTDYLTGQTFLVQKAIKVNLAASATRQAAKGPTLGPTSLP